MNIDLNNIASQLQHCLIMVGGSTTVSTAMAVADVYDIKTQL